MTPQGANKLLEALFMPSRLIEEMPFGELVRLAKTPKGRAYLLERAGRMLDVARQIYAITNYPIPSEAPPADLRSARKRARKSQQTPEMQSQDFDGTVASLASRYRFDPASPYHKLRHKTRDHYDFMINRIVKNYGPRKLADLTEDDIIEVYEQWRRQGKIATGKVTVTVFRILIHFGNAVLHDGACQRLSGVFNTLVFDAPAPRNKRLTEVQARAIASKAHEMGFPSIALAQALQFDCALTQRDVVGEWVPIPEPGVSDITANGKKWLRGARWEEVDENMVFRHPASRDGKILERRLSKAPMVMEEIARIGERPTSGAMIVSKVGVPYETISFRRLWRKIADAAGVPKDVHNTDGRIKDEPEVETETSTTAH
jgi:hypothetical protein